jgi:hypothetical protein
VALDALDAFLSSDRSPPDSAALIFDSGLRVIAKTPLDEPQTASPRPSPVAPRIVRSERGLARRLAKEDRHLRIAPQFFDRDETPAIFVTSLVFDQSEVVRHVERATFRCADRGIRVGRLGFFKPFEDPEFLEMTGLIRFGLKRNTPGKWLRSSQRPLPGPSAPMSAHW